MRLFVFSIALVSWLVISKIVFQKVRRDYQTNGALTKVTMFLQILIFPLHAQLFTISYWDVWSFPADKYLSIPYWLSTAPEMTDSLILLFAGCSLAVAGILILILGFKGLETFARSKGQQVDRLVKTDIYRFTRNPQIFGYGIILFSVPFFWNSLFAFIAALVYWVGARMMVLAEEEHLHRVFRNEYDEYCKRTPRYIGVFRAH